MKPYTRSIIDLFDGKKRYLIPFYQRRYAWKPEPQLQLLWEDIEHALARLKADRQAAIPHFMGAIVIAQIKTYGKQVQAFEVIDGQQRLSTFQLLLAALRDVAVSNNSDYGREIEKLLLNDGVMDTPVERFKLWPRLTDQRAYVQIVEPGSDFSEVGSLANGDDAHDSPAARAHAWFKEKIKEHVVEDGRFNQWRLEAFFEALRDGLATVSIELENGDDPQTIFETLNSRGVDLSAADLMRNFIFQRAKGLGQEHGSLKVDSLYSKYWLPLDGSFWSEGETRGRQIRSRLDWLLVDHLSMKQAKFVSVERLFESYRRWILNEAPFSSLQDELASIARTTAAYQSIIERNAENILGRFGSFSRAFDVSTATPLILFLATDGDVGNDLASAVAMIESFIVRRDICGLTTKKYNLLFIDILEKIRNSKHPLLYALELSLSSGEGDSNRWPDDQEWKSAWLGRSQYRASHQPRLRYLFEAIEKAKRSALNEEVYIKSVLTIEHILPQKWRSHWPIVDADDGQTERNQEDQAAREATRDAVVDRIGNLTLLTHALNATISNSRFSVKMPAMCAQTSLALNRELSLFKQWNEESILSRGEALFAVAKQIWRGPIPRNRAFNAGAISQ